jgi:hypothetical protein
VARLTVLIAMPKEKKRSRKRLMIPLELAADTSQMVLSAERNSPKTPDAPKPRPYNPRRVPNTPGVGRSAFVRTAPTALAPSAPIMHAPGSGLASGNALIKDKTGEREDKNHQWRQGEDV